MFQRFWSSSVVFLLFFWCQIFGTFMVETWPDAAWPNLSGQGVVTNLAARFSAPTKHCQRNQLRQWLRPA